MKINTAIPVLLICLLYPPEVFWRKKSGETADPNSPGIHTETYTLTLDEVLHTWPVRSPMKRCGPGIHLKLVIGNTASLQKASFLPNLMFVSQLPEFSRRIVDVPSIDPATGEVRHDYSS